MSQKKQAKKTETRSRINKPDTSYNSFTPKINLFFVLVLALGTFLTILVLQQRQDVRQNAQTPVRVTLDPRRLDEALERQRQNNSNPVEQNTVPSPVCGGSGQGSVCPSQGPSTPWAPSDEPGFIEPGEPGDTNPNMPWQPSGQPEEIAPGEPDPNNNGGGGNGGNNSGIEGLLNRIIEMLNQIMELIRQILGGGGGNTPGQPGNPGQPSAAPSTAQPSTAQPSQNPGDPGQPSAAPSTAQPSTAQPSTTQPSAAPSNATGDTQAPSTPTNLKATAISDKQIDLTWTASTDNVGVKEYIVYRSEGDSSTGGNSGINHQEKVVGTKTKLSDTQSLKPGIRYYYYVRAFDAAGNKSEHSNTAGATTKAAAKANSLKVTVGLSGQSSLKDKKIPIQLDGPGGFSKTSTQGNTVNKTDSYTFTGLANGKYTLHISYGTYKSVTTTITFDKSGGGETISKSYTLAK